MTGDLFRVDVSSPLIPVVTEGPVVFHGTNKSGSLSMANVLRKSYYAANRADEFFSLYHGIPRHLVDLCDIFRHSRGHNFFVAHNLFGAVDVPAGGAIVTQVRHPLSRTLSIWGWMKRNHLNRHGNLDDIPSFERWVAALKGYKHTQMFQIGMGFAHGAPVRDPDVPVRDILDMATANLENAFAWFGIAELFEESIFALAHLCGLQAVPPWEKDTRNQWREPAAELDENTVALIRTSLAAEFEFYDYAIALFRRRLEDVSFGDTLAPYKSRCSCEYSERLFDRAP